MNYLADRILAECLYAMFARAGIARREAFLNPTFQQRLRYWRIQSPMVGHSLSVLAAGNISMPLHPKMARDAKAWT